MTKILFVDDDPNILRGLRDTLRKQRRVWDMEFLDGGAKALDFLDQNPADIVVSDMRMPQMDGAVLLDNIRVKYPQISRIVLSGHSERDQLVRASAVAHQYLSKPCNGNVLRDQLTQLAAARDRANDSRVLEMVGKLVDLPSVGAMHQELMQSIVGASNPTDALSMILSRESGLAMRVCELANETYRDGDTKFNSGNEVASTLGFERSRSLAILVAVATDLERKGRSNNFNSKQWVTHSIRCARLSEELVKAPQDREFAFSAGLLHDIGCVVHSLNEPQAYDGILSKQSQDASDIHKLEIAAFGFHHGQTGAFLLESWGLSAVVAQACLGHHGKSDPNKTSADTGNTTVAEEICAAVEKANYLLDIKGGGPINNGQALPPVIYDVMASWSSFASSLES